MATLTVRNIPEDLYTAFKAMARKNRRSLNNEVIYRIEQAVNRQRMEPEEMLESAGVVREMLGIYTTNDEITEIIDEGRP